MADRTHNVNYRINAEDRASAAFRSVKNSMQDMERAAGKIRGVLGGLGVGLSFGAFATALVKETLEAEQASARLNAVLRATGGVAGLTRTQLDGLADAMSKATQFDDEDLRNAQAQLVKFGNIHGDTFTRALKASADLAAFMGTDLVTAVQAIGKAVAAPKEGLGALERQIGQLDPVIQKQILSQVEQNRLFEAQDLLLREVTRKIGGTADAMNSGLTKATRDLTKASSDLLKVLGGVASSPISGALDVVTASLERMRRVVESGDWVDKLIAVLSNATLLRLHPLGQLGQLQGLTVGNRQAVSGQLPTQIPGLGDILDFEAALASTDAAKGMTPEEFAREQERERRERERDALEVARQASAAAQTEQEILDEARALGTKFILEQEEKKERALKEGTASLVESAQLVVEANDDQVYSYNALGERVIYTREAFEQLQEQQKKNAAFANDLGLTFSSAFEDAIVAGKKLSEVLRGLAQDILRIALRKLVTEPLTANLAGFFGGLDLFGAGVPDSGMAFAEGTDFVPRTGLALVHQGERIIPADENRAGALGVSVVVNMDLRNVNAMNRAEFYAAIPHLTEAARRGVMEAQARGRR